MGAEARGWVLDQWLAGRAGRVHYSRHSGGECIGHKTRADQGRPGQTRAGKVGRADGWAKGEGISGSCVVAWPFMAPPTQPSRNLHIAGGLDNQQTNRSLHTHTHTHTHHGVVTHHSTRKLI